MKSPLNYTGGKYKLLPQILPLFPSNISTFIDVFGGGFNVGINVSCNRVLYNDSYTRIVEMIQYFKLNKISDMLSEIDYWINKYELSKYNQEGYINFRKEYNANKSPLKLYTLICYAFNYQVRFNLSGDYNMPFGKNRSCFSPSLRCKFIEFVTRLHEIESDIVSEDFREVMLTQFDSKSLYYCDPPYFNALAPYNENGGWSKNDEESLRNILTMINDSGVRFALSNNLSINTTLKDWAVNNGFTIYELNYSYKNCNYQKKSARSDSEVLIVNY